MSVKYTGEGISHVMGGGIFVENIGPARNGVGISSAEVR
jgi:hypothetical protein